MSNLTYEDYKQRLSIQEVLQDAGYVQNPHDGLRYPSFSRLDNEGRRIRGDKFIVTQNGHCCFQPPVQKTFNVISFIKDHPDFFSDYSPGMNLDLLVNKVCSRLLNTPFEQRFMDMKAPIREPRPFNLDNYEIHRFDAHDRDTQKAFYPFFKHRGIDLSTQFAFRQSFVLASRTTSSGSVIKNLSFPITIPGQDGKVVGFEERGRMRRNGEKPYKGKAEGSNASEGLWIASPAGTKLSEASRVLIFESAYDAMAYYQLKHKEDASLRQAVFVSTGGTPTTNQMTGLLKTASSAAFHLCFDNDAAGIQFSANFQTLSAKEGVDNRIIRELPAQDYKDWNDELLTKREKTVNATAQMDPTAGQTGVFARALPNQRKADKNSLEQRYLEQFADLIIKRMETLKDASWTKPWVDSNHVVDGIAYDMIPRNVSGRAYTSWNQLMLQLHTQEKGYAFPAYLTWKQASNLGVPVRHGEHGFPVHYYEPRYRPLEGGKFINDSDYNALPKEQQEKYTYFPVVCYYTVFNIDQTNMKEEQPEMYEAYSKLFNPKPVGELKPQTGNIHMDTMLDNDAWICPIIQSPQSRGACFSTSENRISIPPKANFVSYEEFVVTLLHEMAHSVGVTPECARDMNSSFGTAKYAREELIAELSAAVLGVRLGVNSRPNDNNIAYLQNWIHALRQEPEFLKSVLPEVGKTVNFTINKIFIEEDRTISSSQSQDSATMLENAPKEASATVNQKPEKRPEQSQTPAPEQQTVSTSQSAAKPPLSVPIKPIGQKSKTNNDSGFYGSFFRYSSEYESFVYAAPQVEIPSVGDVVTINEMTDVPEYSGKMGIVTHIDSLGQLHGTWGALAILPGQDDYEITMRKLSTSPTLKADDEMEELPDSARSILAGKIDDWETKKVDGVQIWRITASGQEQEWRQMPADMRTRLAEGWGSLNIDEREQRVVSSLTELYSDVLSNAQDQDRSTSIKRSI